MNDLPIISALRELVVLAVTAFWTGFARLLDVARHVSGFRALLIVIGLLGFLALITKLMQRGLNKRLDENPDEPVPIWMRELRYSLPGLFIAIITLPFKLIEWAMTAVVKVLFKDKKKKDEEKEPPKPVLVASLGPSFMAAGLITAAIYIVGVLVEPLLRLQLDLPKGYPAWQYVLYGHRPELGWYIPLETYPFMAAIVALLFWGSIWWWAGRIVRLVYGGDLGRNLIGERDNNTTLSPWRRWFAATYLWEPVDSYRRWASWLPLVAVPFLIWAWSTIGAEPYRVTGSLFAVTLLLSGSWMLHLMLSGVERLGDEEIEEEEDKTPVKANGWFQVLVDLKDRHSVVNPRPFRPARPVEPLAFTTHDSRGAGLISPLLPELLPKPGRLTHMQHAVLTSLSLQAFVHTDPPTVARELKLEGPERRGVDDLGGLRHRNQIILAPEGAGKTTLAMLAACNHALVHTRCTLVVVRDDERAARLFDRMKGVITPSTLRWNLRVRKVGGDLVNDLAQGIIPDVLVCSLHQLVVHLLDNPSLYGPFLENLGLVVVDDVEAVCGPVEIHAQLGLRRFAMRMRELLGVEQLGEEMAPAVLVLGADSMHDTPAWVRSLCGVDAVARHFGHSNAEIEAREKAEKAAKGQSNEPEEGDEATEEHYDDMGVPEGEELEGPYQVFYRLANIERLGAGPVSVKDIIESCERLAVPWHYRACGDDRRHLGRGLLSFRDEPRYHTDEPADACVVFLEGSHSAVKRELDRLSRAGVNFSSFKGPDGEPASRDNKVVASFFEPIAMITIVDADEEAAFAPVDEHSPLADELEGLPRPIVRPPSGRVIKAHLASELVHQWVEIADLLDVFGNPIATTLHDLAGAGHLLSETRVDVDADNHDYEEKVYVRALAEAIDDGKSDGRDGSRRLLPPRVNQVELTSGRLVTVRDRTNLTTLGQVDADSADHVFYPGCIFEDARGRFVVLGRSAGEVEGTGEASRAANAGAKAGGDILAEPFLADDISSPRRRTRVERVPAHRQQADDGHPAEADAEEFALHQEAFFDPEPVLVGLYPFAVSLSEVQCTTEHVATFRLDPMTGAVRQRIVQNKRNAGTPRPLNTVALCLFPNPRVDGLDDLEVPVLRLGEARLIAAAMRAVLPSMYRGASTSMDIALHVEAADAGPDHVLGSGEGFVIYDLHTGGSGAAQALHRDGVELLLRFARLYLYRLADTERLLARYDHWGDATEIMRSRIEAARAAAEADDAYDAYDDAPGELTAEQVRRARALTWLDSRLMPDRFGDGEPKWHLGGDALPDDAPADEEVST